ncbi:MAG: anthranilate synthase component I family protein [Acidimicrobiia bacterium]
MSTGPVLAALPASLGAAVVRDRGATVIAVEVAELVPAANNPFAALDRVEGGWWAGYVGYEAGARVERIRRDPTRVAEPGTAPEHAWARFSARVEIAPDGAVRWWGRGPARAALERAVATPRVVAPVPPSGTWPTSLDRFAYERRVRTIQELIRAGECYQVNLTRRLDGPPLDPVALWHACESGNPAPHACFWRDGEGLAVVGASPERFASVEGRRVETRPIKGTAARAGRLRASEKDRAENVMIVDLARNDLGRVCVPGSIHVPELCVVEAHPGLVHLVSTVRGTLRDDVGVGGFLRAAFPPASITGAPKPRVMQAIEELEPVGRGVYCGATGWLDRDAERADLAVAIRTFTCTPTATTFGVGAGITIDSDAAAEWHETELKSARLLALAGAGAADAPDPAAHLTGARS